MLGWFAPALLALLAIDAVARLDPGLSPDSLLHLRLINALPFLLIGLLIWLLSARTLFSLLCLWLIIAAVFAINELKILQLGEPVLPGDLLMVPQILGNLGFFVRYAAAPSPLWLLVPLAALLLWLEPRGFRLRLRWRTLLATLPLGLLFSLGFGTWPWPAVYTSPPMVFDLWVPRDSVSKSGLAAYFIRQSWSTSFSVDAADRELIGRLVNDLQPAGPASLPAPAMRPDVIIVQSESFFDPARLKDFDSTALLPNLHRLTTTSLSGDLQVPAYGGMTTRTEFELLTGVTLRAFPAIRYPYEGIVHQRMYSLAHALRELGYRTVAVHPFLPSFYRRDVVYPRLGFDSFISHRNFGDTAVHGFYVSDEALVDRLLGELDRADGQPSFLFAVTMENHGPWGQSRQDRLGDVFRDIPVPAKLAAPEARSLQAYLHHLRRADIALGRLADALRERDRPSVLLFFGDHLPGLTPVFEAIGFRDGRAASEQPVPYLIVRFPTDGNAAAVRRNLDADQLGALLLQVSGLLPRGHFETVARLADSDVPAATAMALRRELALAALEDARSGAASAAEGTLRVFDWHPRQLPGDDSAQRISVRVSGDSTGVEAVLGNNELQVDRLPEHLVLTAEAGMLSTSDGNSRSAPLSLRLADGTIQHVGDITILPPKQQATAPAAVQSLCDVESWGPRSSPAGQPSNRQPDGSQGLWFRMPCASERLRVEIDGQTMQTWAHEGLITAKLPLELMQDPARLRVRVVDSTSAQARDLGMIDITPRQVRGR